MAERIYKVVETPPEDQKWKERTTRIYRHKGHVTSRVRNPHNSRSTFQVYEADVEWREVEA